MSSPTPARVKPLAVQVYEQLRTAILREDLAPGTRLIEMDLAAQLGTSQGPIREALQRLERDGLVRRHAHISTFVTEISDEEMQELFCIRSLIERFAVRRALPHITSERIAELEALVERMHEAGARNDMLAFTEQDMLFHRLICQWSRSYSLLRAWDPLYSQIQRFVVHTHNRYFKDIAAIADTHVPILDALRSGDLARAQHELHEHMLLIWRLMETSQRAEIAAQPGAAPASECDETRPV